MNPQRGFENLAGSLIATIMQPLRGKFSCLPVRCTQTGRKMVDTQQNIVDVQLLYK
jgi:hypothetical protein